MSIGAYTFLTPNYREMQYPADLWIQHNSKFFDELALFTYGKIDLGINLPENVKIVEGPTLESSDFSGFRFYTYGKTKAMEALSTEWKVILESDEFISKRMDTSNFNRFFSYPLGFIQLYGNISTEIKSAFLVYLYRIHYGNKKIISDGGPRPPYSGKIHLNGIVNLIQRKVFKSHLTEYNPIWTADEIENWAYHTNCLRSPEIMSDKWIRQMKMEIEAGIKKSYYNEWLGDILSRPFEYRRYKEFWPGSYLKKVSPPGILVQNASRFTKVQFKPDEYND